VPLAAAARAPTLAGVPPDLVSASPGAEGDVMSLTAPPQPLVTSHRVTLADGAATTVHVVVHPRAHVVPAVVMLAAPEPLASWCTRTGVPDAIVGGFFVTPAGPALGAVRVAGRPLETVPFDARFAGVRACLHVHGDALAVAPLAALPAAVAGDVLQAGPALLAGGRTLLRPGEDREGFSAGHTQFDSDITHGRHPRSALGFDAERLIAVVADGRAPGEAGLTLPELAGVMRDLGAVEAINLDGGGSASLVAGGRLVNRPREGDGRDIPGGRPVVTALAFLPRAQRAAAAA